MLSDPPNPDEMEVSIFGPGKGESIVVHLGQDRWIIIDSCVDQRSKGIPALEYLDRIGVDVAERVLMVVGTHAHDDHISGISDIYSRCLSAPFVCAVAQTSDEFVKLVELESELQGEIRDTIRHEYNAVFKEAERRGAAGAKSIRYALSNRPLASSGNPREDGFSVLSLSPSDYSFTRAQQALARAYAVAREARKPSKVDPNEFAVALWVEAMGHRVLLGADLVRGPAGCGWSAVLDWFNPEAKASLFKVPHHGSPNAHREAVWTQLLEDSPTALLAPYRAGRRPRPSGEDINRINRLSGKAFITANSKYPKKSTSEQRDAAAISTIGMNVRQAWGKCGHVRARAKRGGSQWTIALTNPAQELR